MTVAHSLDNHKIVLDPSSATNIILQKMNSLLRIILVISVVSAFSCDANGYAEYLKQYPYNSKCDGVENSESCVDFNKYCFPMKVLFIESMRIHSLLSARSCDGDVYLVLFSTMKQSLWIGVMMS